MPPKMLKAIMERTKALIIRRIHTNAVLVVSHRLTPAIASRIEDPRQVDRQHLQGESRAAVSHAINASERRTTTWILKAEAIKALES